ncbi:MAG: hypothetical protein JWN44_5141 [Myxococcales bacterium]|nr:hypothetical protein [Myxococcales bacterium]
MIRFAPLLIVLAAGCLGTTDKGMTSADLALPGSDGNGDDLATGEAPADMAMPAGPADLGRTYSTDPGTFLGASRCAALGAILCDDFEAGKPGDKPNAQVWTPSGDVTLDSAQFARGKQALHLHIVGQAWATIAETKTFPAAGNHFFGRLFFRATAIPTTNPTAAHWTLVAGAGNGTPEIREGGISGKWGTGTDNRAAGGTGDWTNEDKDPTGAVKPVPANQWACIEWEYDGGKNETRFWWDGVEHPSMHTTSTLHGGDQTVPYLLPTFTNVKIGWMLYQAPVNPTTFDIWIDEIAIDSVRIGCNN